MMVTVTLLALLAQANDGGAGPLTPIIIAVVTTLGVVLAGGLLFYGPTRKNITSEATEKAVRAIDDVRETLENRLKAVEVELADARKKIRALENELELAHSQRRATVAELELERDHLLRRVERLEAEARDYERLGIKRKLRDIDGDGEDGTTPKE